MRVALVSETTRWGDARKALRPLRVAVAGLGVVGEGVALRLLKERRDFRLCAALVRDRAKPRAAAFRTIPLVGDAPAFLAERPDIVVDALSCGAVGRALIEQALEQGAHVVTANKQAIAGSLADLHDRARRNGAMLAYAPSVGGGAPMIETVRRARDVGKVRAITAVLNGTVNFILTEIRRGAAFADAVRAAQIAGFAEPDPSADLSGEDARAKVSILAYEMFGKEPAPASIAIEALDETRAAGFAQDGRAWKQLAVIEAGVGGGIWAAVRYGCVDGDAFLGSIEGEENALRIFNGNGGVFACSGKGAGRAPTVESVFSDLYAIRDKVRTAASGLSLRPEPALR